LTQRLWSFNADVSGAGLYSVYRVVV
jgi:hypothetical protein